MKILSVHISGFGKFREKDIEFGKAVNVIRGQNEAGKSTLHSFLEAMLLGPNKKPRGFSRSVYEAMEPWEEDADYAGTMRIEQDGEVYQIEREFTRGAESLKIYREETGEEVPDPEEFLKEVMEELTPEACRNSISIGQLSARTGAALQRELSGYIENVGSTANPDLSARKAVEYLEQKKENLRAQIRDDAARDYAAALSRIRKIETDLDKPENENRIRFFEKEQEAVQGEISGAKEHLTQTEERIGEATRILEDNQIHTRADVDSMEATARELYGAYEKALEKKKSSLRLAGIIISGLLLAVSAVAAYLKFQSPEKIWFLGAVVLAAIVLTVLIVRQILAEKEYRKAVRALTEYMEPRIGAKEIGKESQEKLLKFIHSYDGMLADREKDQEARAVLEQDISRLTEQETETVRNLEEQNEIRIRVEDRLSEENRLRDEAAALRQRIARNNQLKEEIDAIDIAMDTIGDLSDTIKGRLGTYLNNEASRALKSLTGGHYRSMDIGSGSDMSLNAKDGMISVTDVSAGTIDQIYLAVRIAAARFMMKEKDSLPLIFDDSFALFDDDRLKSAVNFVARDYQGQIFIFTCHHREEAALEEKAGCRLVEL